MKKNLQQKKVVVLGSTGSIGKSTLDVIRAMPDRFRVAGLSACNSLEKLSVQLKEFRPAAVAVAGEKAEGSQTLMSVEPGCRVYWGRDGLSSLVADTDADIVVGAITGWAGVRPCLQALKKGVRLALANKETLVVGGQLVKDMAERFGSCIFPVDSEESAIFQSMQAGARKEVNRVFLTASGGPFYDWPAEKLKTVTLKQALRHPNWDMGPKITIDSATLMNKALEIVETRWLFDILPEKITVLLHPQSIVHSMVEFNDLSIIAQLGAPDMKVPIQYALTYPDRASGPGQSLGFESLRRLELRAVEPSEFPALEIGYQVAREGGTSGAVMNAANEVAVDYFLNGRISFNRIVETVRQVLSRHDIKPVSGLAELEQADVWARREAEKCLR